MPRFSIPKPAWNMLLECSKGAVQGHSLVHKFGRNPSVANGAWEIVGPLSASTVFLSAPTTVRLASGGNAADTAAGLGGREVTIAGLGTGLTRIATTVATAGGAASSSTIAQFWRVDRAYLSAVGSYTVPVNTGNIVIQTTGGTSLNQISAGEGQTQHCAYAVPTGFVAYLLSVDITVDSAQSADIRLFSRANLDDTTVPVSPKRLRHFWDGVVGNNVYKPLSPDFSIAGPADIWIEAQGAGAGTEVTASFELLLVER